ncbi:MAG: hypothetical protein AB1439_10110 [candidate division FCPU426 bacterium]
MREAHDSLTAYCRLLGHTVAFSYCRSQGLSQLCRQILNCWFERLPIEEYIRAEFGEAELARLTRPSPPKMLTLIELIEQARRSGGEPSQDD